MDSTLVSYSFDSESNTYKGDHAKSKTTPEKILTYSLSASEELFINSHQKLLRQWPNSKDIHKRQAVLWYLEKAKETTGEEY